MLLVAEPADQASNPVTVDFDLGIRRNPIYSVAESDDCFDFCRTQIRPAHEALKR